MSTKTRLFAVASCAAALLFHPVALHADTAEQFVPPGGFLEDGTTGTETGTTPDGRLRFEILGEYAVYQGDIVLGKATDILNTSNTVLLRGLSRNSDWDRWIDGLIYYKLSDALDATARAKIAAAIDHWNTRSSVSLIEVTPELDSSVPDYVKFEAASGCASYVGRNGGEQALWVAPQCTVGSIIHEIGHAAGLFHEHTRSDRDSFVTVNWDIISDDKRMNFDIMDTGVELIGDYEYGSIMHYGSSFFSKTGGVTLSAPDGITIGQREALSPGDLAAIDQIYGTDLSLNVTQETNEDGSFDFTVQITNEGQLGAHNLKFTVPLNDGNTNISMIPSAWTCANHSDKLVCDLPTLAEQNSSLLNLRQSSGSLMEWETAYLTSKTFDFDPSNNGPIPEEESESKETNTEQTGGEESESEETDTSGSTTGGTAVTDSGITNGTEPVLGSANPASSSGGGGIALWMMLLTPFAFSRRNRKK